MLRSSGGYAAQGVRGEPRGRNSGADLAPARFFLSTCAIIFLSVVAIGITPSGTEGWAALDGMQRIAVFATMATGAVLLAVSMIGQMVPGNKYALAPALLPIGVLTVLIIILSATFRPRAEPAFVESALKLLRIHVVTDEAEEIPGQAAEHTLRR